MWNVEKLWKDQYKYLIFSLIPDIFQEKKMDIRPDTRFKKAGYIYKAGYLALYIKPDTGYKKKVGCRALDIKPNTRYEESSLPKINFIPSFLFFVSGSTRFRLWKGRA